MLQRLRNNPSESLSDEALLERFVSGGSVAHLGALYERYMPMVYGICLKILREPGLAEDAVMAIYEEVARKLREHRVDSFRGWLYVLARNHCLMEYRKAKRQPTDLYAPETMRLFDAADTPFEGDVPATNGPGLDKCLNSLVEMQRTCVQMFYYEDKSYKEIAEMMADEIGKIRSYIQNGRRNLRICLEKAGIISNTP